MFHIRSDIDKRCDKRLSPAIIIDNFLTGSNSSFVYNKTQDAHRPPYF